MTFGPFFLLILGLTGSVAAEQSTAEPAASADSTVSPVDLPAELDRVLRDYEQGWRTRNAEGLASLFTPDGFIMRPGHPPTRGRQAIAEAYRGSGGSLFLNAIHYATADSVGYILGTYRHHDKGADSGKFILTLQLQADGRWYITADMDNGNG